MYNTSSLVSVPKPSKSIIFEVNQMFTNGITAVTVATAKMVGINLFSRRCISLKA